MGRYMKGYALDEFRCAKHQAFETLEYELRPEVYEFLQGWGYQGTLNELYRITRF